MGELGSALGGRGGGGGAVPREQKRSRSPNFGFLVYWRIWNFGLLVFGFLELWIIGFLDSGYEAV